MKGAAHLAETLLAPATADLVSPEETACSLSLGFSGSLFEWFNLPGSEFRLQRFGTAMKGLRAFGEIFRQDLQRGEHRGSRLAVSTAECRWVADRAWARIVATGFPFGSLGEGATLVDVGGGVGAASLMLTAAFPNLAITVQDRPEVVTGEARAVWQKQDPAALTSGRVTLAAHDFFTPQPIKGAAVYFLRTILHDWADPYSLPILQHLRDTAAPESRLVVVDSIIEPLCPTKDATTVEVEGAAFDDAGEWPLLPVINPASYLVDMVSSRPSQRGACCGRRSLVRKRLTPSCYWAPRSKSSPRLTRRSGPSPSSPRSARKRGGGSSGSCARAWRAGWASSSTPRPEALAA